MTLLHVYLNILIQLNQGIIQKYLNSIELFDNFKFNLHIEEHFVGSNIVVCNYGLRYVLNDELPSPQ